MRIGFAHMLSLIQNEHYAATPYLRLLPHTEIKSNI